MTRKFSIACIRIFQALSHALQAQGFPLFATTACRKWPTCSEYAVDAIATKGAVRGTILAARRIASCHPFAGSHA